MENQETCNKAINKRPAMKANYIFSLMLQLLTYIVPLLTAPYLSRVLGSNGIGSNSYAFSMVSYFTLFVSFGFLTYGSKEIAGVRDDKEKYSVVFWEIFFSRMILFFLSFGLYFSFAFFWSFGKSELRNVLLLYALMLGASFLDVTYLFQGLENFKIVSIINIVIKIVATILIFVFVKNKDDLALYVLINAGHYLIIALTTFLLGFRFIKKPFFKEIDVLKCLKKGFIYFLPTIAISIYTILDKTMIGYLANMDEVGYYEEAYKTIALCTGLINAISPVVLSRVSFLVSQGNQEEIDNKLVQVGHIYSIMAWPMLFGLIAVSRYFFPAFFGEEFIPSIGIAYILSPLILIVPISNQVGSAYYVPRGKTGLTALFFLAGALFNFGTNFIAIPLLGGKGAAITSLVSELIISSLFIVFSRKEMPYKAILKTEIKPLISSLLMFGILLIVNYFILRKYINNVVVATLIMVFSGVVVYAISLVALKDAFIINRLRFRRNIK